MVPREFNFKIYDKTLFYSCVWKFKRLLRYKRSISE